MTTISAFDLDHTLIRANCSYSFALYLLKKGHLSWGAFPFLLKSRFLFQFGKISLVDLHESAFQRLFYGLSEGSVTSWAEDYVDRSIDGLLRTSVYTKFLEAKRDGHLTALLSSSPLFLVEPIAKRLGFSFCDGTRYAVDKDRRFCHISQLMLSENKVECLNQLKLQCSTDHPQMITYSDSHHDLPFLLAAETPIAVAPDHLLRRHCKKYDWPIIEK